MTATDRSGSTATWEFVLRTPRVHVLLAYFNFVSPHGNARVDARIVLVVNTAYMRDNNKESFIQHNVNAYVKVDSRGWKTAWPGRCGRWSSASWRNR